LSDLPQKRDPASSIHSYGADDFIHGERASLADGGMSDVGAYPGQLKSNSSYFATGGALMKKRLNRKLSALARCIESLESRVLLTATNKLVFLSQPTDSVAGATIAPVIQIAVETPGGALVTSDTSTVTIALDSDTVEDGVTLSGTLGVAAVKGIATFTDLSINSTNGSEPIQLAATDGSLTAGESAEFNILPAAPTQLAIDSQSTSAKAGEALDHIVVDLEDKFGNLADVNGSKVTLSIATGPTGATMGGSVAAYISEGQAFFTDISFETAGTYTLKAAAGNFTTATTSNITISANTASQVAFGTAPASGTAGTLPSVTAQIEDAFGNVVTTNTTKVTLALSTGPAGGTLGGTLQQTASAGVATFGDLALQKAGTYTIHATDGNLTATTSAPVVMAAGAATKLAFVQAPSAAKAGAVISPAITVAVEDQFGNVVTTDKSKITAALGTTPDGAKLAGTAIIAAANGVATFSTLMLTTAGSYTITMADGSLTGATSDSFTISPADSSQLVYGTAPAAATAGAKLTAFTVKVEDKFGNVVTGNSSSVTIGIGTGPTGATVAGTATVSASSGVATFSAFKLNTAGNYTLKATDGLLTPVTSAAVAITADVASQLAISPVAASVVAGATIPPVKVTVEDQFGNVVTGDTSSVTVLIVPETGADGAVLSGTATTAAVNGVATFSTLSINLAGSGDTAYRLGTTDGELDIDVSNTFAVTPAAASQVVFKKSPTDAKAGAVISPNVTVMVEDKFGNLVTTDASKVTLSVATGPSITPPKKISSKKSKKVKATSTLPTLGGTVTVAAVNGLATFTDLTLPTTGAYTLAAADGKLTAAASSSFAISANTAAQIAFGTQPVTAAAGAVLTGFTAQVEDAFGNVVTTDTSKITVAIASGPDGATISAGTVKETASAGVSTFGDIAFNTAGTYTLTATDGNLTAGTSAAFIITPGAANKLAFAQQPTAAIAGSAIAPAVTVLVEDALGNVVNTDASKITMAIGSGPDGVKLAGTSLIGAAKGIATFSGLSIPTASSYTLTASDGSLTGATSNSFAVTAGAAAKLAFASAPTGTSAGNHLSEVDVDVEDKNGNIVTTDNSFVTLSAATGPVGATLGAYATFRAVNGVAAFTNVNFTVTGNYTIKASDAALTAAVSSPIAITPGVKAELVFSKSPVTTIAGNKFAPVTVTMLDEFGNVSTDFTGNVTLAIATGTGPTGATLGGTLTEAAVSGVATFSDLAENTVGSYKLSATTNFITPVLSSSFNVTPAAASQLVIVQGPQDVTAGHTFGSNPTVFVEDKFGNLVNTDTSKVTVSVATPTGGVVVGTLTQAAVGGIATFNDLAPSTAGAMTLKFADGKLTTDTSDSFTVAPGNASKVAFGAAPVGAVAGVTMTAVTASVEDQFGNVVTGDTSNVKIALATNPDGATLSGTATVAASAGVATFSDLKLNTAGPYTFTVTDGNLTSATTATPITITPAAASKVVFGQTPSDAVAGVAIGPTVTAQVEDAFNNVVTTDTSKVTISVNAGPTGAAITGTAQVAAVKGVATFTGISLSTAGTGYKLALADGNLTGATSSTFKVTAGAAAKLVFLQAPTAAAKTVAISPDVTVQVQDKFGNVVATDTSNVTVALATNTTSGTLSGTLMVAADTGVADFDDLAIDKAGTYTMKATDGSLTLATSASFVIS
jgi:hypothetical protein